MSAQPYEAEPAGPGLAQPAVDILPAAAPRKGKQQPQPDAVSAPEEDWPQPPPGAVNPWTGLATAATDVPVDAAPPQLTPTSTDDVPATAGDADEPRRFLGVQLRRGRKGTESVAVDVEAGHVGAPPAPVAPIAAWPTDLGGTVVAHAEPESLTTSTWASGVLPPAAPPLEAPAEPARVEAVVEAVVEVVVEPSVPLVDPAPAAHDEVRALTSLLQASEAQRSAAESRAEQAVAYAQQTQAEMHQRDGAASAQVAALETRIRTLANEVQDWQIRHREAEAQVAELVQSVAGTEARLAEMRSERDDLLAALEDATRPDGTGEGVEALSGEDVAF